MARLALEDRWKIREKTWESLESESKTWESLQELEFKKQKKIPVVSNEINESKLGASWKTLMPSDCCHGTFAVAKPPHGSCAWRHGFRGAKSVLNVLRGANPETSRNKQSRSASFSAAHPKDPKRNLLSTLRKIKVSLVQLGGRFAQHHPL